MGAEDVVHRAVLVDDRAARRRQRFDTLRAHSGTLTGAYGPRYLDQLRKE
jgi:hypothetical protein